MAAASKSSDFSKADEERIIKKRLLTHTVHTSAAPPPFKKLMHRYTELCRALTETSTGEAAKLHNEVLADLLAVQALMHRLEATAAGFRREQNSYHAKQEALHAAIAQAQQDINDRKAQLEEARAEVGRQQEYEAVKERVVKVPSRSATRSEMAVVEREIVDLEQQGEQIEGWMAARMGQFAAMLHVIHDTWQLQAMDVDAQEEGQAAAGSGSAEPMAD